MIKQPGNVCPAPLCVSPALQSQAAGRALLPPSRGAAPAQLPAPEGFLAARMSPRVAFAVPALQQQDRPVSGESGVLCCPLLALQTGSHPNSQLQAEFYSLLPSAQRKHLGQLFELLKKQLQSPKMRPLDVSAALCCGGKPEIHPCRSAGRGRGKGQPAQTPPDSKRSISSSFHLKQSGGRKSLPEKQLGFKSESWPVSRQVTFSETILAVRVGKGESRKWLLL